MSVEMVDTYKSSDGSIEVVSRKGVVREDGELRDYHWVKIKHLDSDPKTGEINLSKDRAIALMALLTEIYSTEAKNIS